MTNIEKAEKKIVDRLRTIEAALHDLNPTQFRQETGWTRATDPMAFQVHRNRVALLLLNLYHLRDDARGLARRRGLDQASVDSFCDSSAAISLSIKAGDTYKHGIGGRTGNNTVIEYEVVICRQDGHEPRPTDPVVNVVKLIIDENGEPHQSDVLAVEALRDWLQFLEHQLGLDMNEWRQKWDQSAMPPGMSVYSCALPPGFLRQAKEAALARRWTA
jgi:hypothetical protein